MKRILVLVIAILTTLCAAGETLDLDQYGGYTGQTVENSAEIIQDIMDANVIRDIIAENGGIRQDVFIPQGESMTFYRGEVAAIVDGIEVRQIIEASATQIYLAEGTAYMIENGSIFTMPVENLPVTVSALDDFVFVYDETERVLGIREWEKGEVVLARAEDMWLEYFLDGEYFICAIKTYEGEEAPECTGYITVEAVPQPEVPSFIIREAMK